MTWFWGRCPVFLFFLNNSRHNSNTGNLCFRNTTQTMISLPRRVQTLWPSSHYWRSDCYLHWWASKPEPLKETLWWVLAQTLMSPGRSTLYGSILRTTWRWRAAGMERICPSHSTSSCRAACKTGSWSDSVWSRETVHWRREKRQRRRLVEFWILCLMVFVFAVRYASDDGWSLLWQ